ncbi:hypothetical protein SUGI_1006800 [Cryptomeria japonica]|uniref:G-type lectin S-receptor-like serine/threonine-protein kinase LECRK2 n=1 Tax=Cryptomeria japonica TaxID=3369 RepID=UPI002414B452|nr:G-type lectin S-receptor-like serine/threonine-protein kinase LECRK2 [Cryptomeria japonica]GLJ47669.1 hypothetical protein SUGI_1006800 [Cryptomeria japonica]
MASATLTFSIVFIISMVVCVLSHSRLTPYISLRSTLTAGSQNFKWVSPNGEFAFGFHSVTPPLYSVGVWFDNISEFTFAWTAKTDNIELRLERGSTLQLSNAGLQVLDSQRRLKWAAGPAENENESVSAAAILNSGNFVLLNQSAAPIWQSFDAPTDTLLPGQSLTSKYGMLSKSSSTNFSSGRFGLAMKVDGDLVFYLVERLEDKGVYWRASDKIEDYDSYCEVELKFNRSGSLYLVNSSDIEVATLSTGGEGDGQFLRRVTLDTDGVLRQYVWNQMGSGAASWSSVWQVLDDPCTVKGLCGLNSVCQLIELKKPNCLCLPGFDFMDTEDPSRGCRSNSSQDYSCSARREMVPIPKTNWAKDNDYSNLQDVSESDCMQACSDDCMCIVVTYENNMCYKKRMPLIDGRQGYGIASKAFVKVTDLSIAPFSPPSILLPHAQPVNVTKEEMQGKGKVVLMVGISLVGCSSILATATFLLTWFFRSSIHNTGTNTVQEKAGKSRNLKAFSYKEIQAATGGFRQELGRGAFGKVYRGELLNGRAIAVKTLDKLVHEGQGEKEFRTEVSIIGTSHHRNLVQLYGFCDEGAHKFLVYEYMSNGSLDGVLFVDSGFLSWELRVGIAIGTARGILYLHQECATQIIHCDIKPQNILLDEKYNPKISDFGLAKLMKAEHTRTFTAGARGTKGYMAPEWHRNVAVTVKVDVYSFGVMLLEIICCKKTVHLDEETESLLCDWVYECFRHGRLVQLVEQQQLEGDTIEPRQLERMVLTALWCIQDNPALRPSIKKVVQMLEGTVEIAVPPPP